MGRLRPERGAREALEAALGELQAAFEARSVLFVARDASSGRLYRKRGSSSAREADSELDSTDELTYLFPAPAGTWYAVEHGNGGDRFDVVALTDRNRPRKAAVAFPKRFLAAHRFHSLLVVSEDGPDQWINRLLLFDARVDEGRLRLLQSIARLVGPTMCSIELLARLRSLVGAAERARVAGYLHDGIIQALIGLEMQVDVWRREAGPDAAAASRLRHIQHALRAEVFDLRDLIQRIKPSSVDSEHVLEHLADLVGRFERASGINAHFVSEADELTLAPHVCGEVVRIVQEALANVRKHSGARNVLVRVSAPEGYWKFEVDDDGRGFEFQGRYSHAELDFQRKGPVLIKERVRAIGAQLAVESDPGQGARVEVWISRPPQ